MIVTISIDDVHPQKEWRILGDKTEEWLRSLNDEFGAKFVLFIPSNYHQKFPLSEHKEWIQELNSIPWLELAAHGHYHQTSDHKRFGECEFLELDTYKTFLNRLYILYEEWEGVGVIPKGWKNPGWLCSEVSCKLLNGRLATVSSDYEISEILWKPQYVSLHYEHNHDLKWNCKTFFGHDGIQQSDISIHNTDIHPEGMIMFTSHIAGDWNDNVWNERNCEQLRLSLEYLTTEFQCEFKTLNEC